MRMIYYDRHDSHDVHDKNDGHDDQDDLRMPHHLFREPHRHCARTVASQSQGYSQTVNLLGISGDLNADHNLSRMGPATIGASF